MSLVVTERMADMKKLLIRAALDILRLENRVEELEAACKVPPAERFSVRLANGG